MYARRFQISLESLWALELANHEQGRAADQAARVLRRYESVAPTDSRPTRRRLQDGADRNA